ncbi:MAG: aldose 1-epimerase [Burkholderiales bacterium]|nr:aldose 1-epimerase [Burkholderiales bacterium]
MDVSKEIAYSISAGELESVFLPGMGMICTSLRHRGEELLRRVDDLEASAERGSAAGIPLLHPWANRLATYGYSAAGRQVALDPASPLLNFDAQHLPIHGVPWSRLAWELKQVRKDGLVAGLDWDGDALLQVFPYRHRLEMAATLHPQGLTLETTLVAGQEAAVPVSFGFHPYFGLPGLARSQWRLVLPAMRRLVLDRQLIPTGEQALYAGMDAALGELEFDDGFATLAATASFSLEGAGMRITLELLEGYAYAQVFAPRDKDYVALEPMTAPTNALISGSGLQLVPPGGRYRAAFRIGVDTLA